MRVAFLGASHWHLDLYLRPALESGVELVGVTDPDPVTTRALSARLDCRGDSDFRKLCRETRPDFVFALGRHVDMPSVAEYLIAERIPFAVEKPCGLDQRSVASLAEAAERASVFAAVPLVFRQGAFAALLRDHAAAAGGFQHMTFHFIAGLPERYRRSGCDWMLDPALSGGGVTINLAVHFLDLCRTLLGPDIRVATSVMTNTAWREHVEDYSLLTLRSDSAVAVIETGYLLPAPNAAFDMHFSLRSDAGYIIAHDPNTVEVVGNDGRSETLAMVTTNVPLYRDFTIDVLRRAQGGEQPVASLADMVPVMALVDEAYAKSGRPEFHPGPGRRSA